MIHFFSSDAPTINTILVAASARWVSFTDEADNSEVWYRTKKFGEQWGVIIASYDGDIIDVDICISDEETIMSSSGNDVTLLSSIAFIEEVQGRCGLQFLIWVKNVILQMQEGQVPNWEDPVRGMRLCPLDERRARVYRRMKRHGFVESDDGDFLWTK